MNPNSIIFSLGLTYCTLNKIHRDDLLHVLRLYPDFASSFIERFCVTFDLRQCELNESKPFHKLDDEIKTLIRERNPKLQTERRLSVLSQREDGQGVYSSSVSLSFSLEQNRLAALRSYRGIRMSLDQGNRRTMNTIVELSPDQAQLSPDDIDFSRDSGGVSLSPLAQGKTTSNGKPRMRDVAFHRRDVDQRLHHHCRHVEEDEDEFGDFSTRTGNEIVSAKGARKGQVIERCVIDRIDSMSPGCFV